MIQKVIGGGKLVEMLNKSLSPLESASDRHGMVQPAIYGIIRPRNDSMR